MVFTQENSKLKESCENIVKNKKLFYICLNKTNKKKKKGITENLAFKPLFSLINNELKDTEVFYKNKRDLLI